MTVLGQAARPAAVDLLPAMLDIAGSGNRVIAAYVAEALHTLIMFTRPRSLASTLTSTLAGGPGGHKGVSNTTRELCAECIRTALETFPDAEADRQRADLTALAVQLLSDASEGARATGRHCMALLKLRFEEPTLAAVAQLPLRLREAVTECDAWSAQGGLADSVAPVLPTGTRSDHTAAVPAKTPAPAPSASAGAPPALPRSPPRHDEGSAAGGKALAKSDTGSSHASVHGEGGAGDARSKSAGHGRPGSQARARRAGGSSGGPGRHATGPAAMLHTVDDAHGKALYVGSPVLVTHSSHGSAAGSSRAEALGWVRWMGRPAFAEGVWLGLQLASATGKNDGTVQGERYFHCPPQHGLFVRPKNVAWQDTPTEAGASVEAAAPALPEVPAVSGVSLADLLVEHRAHVNGMLEVLKAEFVGVEGVAEDEQAAARLMLAAVEERLALDRLWYVRVAGFAKGQAAASEGEAHDATAGGP